MNNRISSVEKKNKDRKIALTPEPRPIGAILAELLAQYQARFPEARDLHRRNFRRSHSTFNTVDQGGLLCSFSAVKR